MDTHFFTPGPSQLYPTVGAHIARALADNVASVSHRSKQFMAFYAETESNLRELLSIPEGHRVFFLSSANEAWERILQNAVQNASFHYINGSFSEKFYTFAEQLKKYPRYAEAEKGSGFTDPAKYFPVIGNETELIAFCANETSTGVATTADFIYAHAAQFPEKLIAVDLVSAWPHYAIDLEKVDFAYFSVQKAFGMPAGLGVLVVSERGLNAGSAGTYHSFESLAAKAAVHQTPETPNSLAIYLLGKVAGDMLERGIAQIREETTRRAATLYGLIASHSRLGFAVANPALRSETTIVADCDDAAGLIQQLAQAGLAVGAGYGDRKKDQIRIANFPGHDASAFQRLVQELHKF